MPPRPRRVDFPPTAVVRHCPKEETPSRTPWWLTAASTRRPPRWSSSPPPARSGIRRPASRGSAPLVILLDDGWSAAATWETRIKAADELIAKPTTTGVASRLFRCPSQRANHADARRHRARRLRQLAPKPCAVSASRRCPRIERFLKATATAEIVWLRRHDTGRGAEFLSGLARPSASARDDLRRHRRLRRRSPLPKTQQRR